MIGSIRIGRSYLVKYLATNSYVPFIIVFMNKILDNKPKDFLIDDSDDINNSYDIDDINRDPYIYMVMISIVTNVKMSS